MAGEGTNTSTLTHEYAAASGCLESYIVKSFTRSWSTPTGKTISLHMTVDHQVIAACMLQARTDSFNISFLFAEIEKVVGFPFSRAFAGQGVAVNGGQF